MVPTTVVVPLVQLAAASLAVKVPIPTAHRKVAVLDSAWQVAERLFQQARDRKAAHPHGIDGEEQEAALAIQQPRAIGDEAGEVFLQPPYLALGPAAELGGIEDDAVILCHVHRSEGFFGRRNGIHCEADLIQVIGDHLREAPVILNKQ